MSTLSPLVVLPFVAAFIAAGIAVFVCILYCVFKGGGLLRYLRTMYPAEFWAATGEDPDTPWWTGGGRGYIVGIVRYVYSTRGDSDLVVQAYKASMRAAIRLFLCLLPVPPLVMLVLWVVTRIVR